MYYFLKKREKKKKGEEKNFYSFIFQIHCIPYGKAPM